MACYWPSVGGATRPAGPPTALLPTSLITHSMPVLWITVILSLLLALVFLVLFVKEHRRFHFGSSERSALLPLEDDAPPSTARAPQHAQPPPSTPPANPPPPPRRS